MTFGSIVGQERVVRVLRKALSSGNLPHAYLFYGPEGVGRFRTALTLAGALFCRSAKEDTCGACTDCSRVEREAHPGLTVIRPQSRKGEKEWTQDPIQGEIRIDQIRELQKWLAGRSFEGGWRVCIVDGAEKVNSNAANALLKTLEEPPPESLIVLISPLRTQVPATVASRCQGMYFAPVSRESLMEFLQGKREGASEALSLVAALSEGSVGKALRMDAAWLSGERRQWIQRLVSYTGQCGKEATVDFAADLADCDRLDEVLSLFLLWYRDLVICSGVGDPDRLLNRDLIQEIQEVSVRGDIQSWLAKMQALGQTKKELDGRVRLNRRLVMEDLLFKLAEKGDAV